MLFTMKTTGVKILQGRRYHAFLVTMLIFFANWPGTSEGFTVTAPTPARHPIAQISRTFRTRRNAKEDSPDWSDAVSDFCQGTNEFWKSLVIEPVRGYVEVNPAETTVTSDSDALTRLTAPPERPGIPRPVWLTILGSVPTGLFWYGYYKFSVEEEIYQYEMQETGRVSGAGGYGTLFPFVYGIIIGFPMTLLHIPGGEVLVEAAGLWILLGQINLYKRVNELCLEDEEVMAEIGLSEAPLFEWWAILPPPLDVVVGLRQVHFLSEFWRVKRGYAYEKDVIAEELFPFISMKERFTLKQFFRRPKYWFWFTKDWSDFDDITFLQD